MARLSDGSGPSGWGRSATPGAAFFSAIFAIAALGGAGPAAAACGVSSALHSTGVHTATGTGGIHTGASAPHVSSGGKSCPTATTAPTAHVAGLTAGSLSGVHSTHAFNAVGRPHPGHPTKEGHNRP